MAGRNQGLSRYLLLRNRGAAGERDGMGKVNRQCAAADGSVSGAARTLFILLAYLNPSEGFPAYGVNTALL